MTDRAREIAPDILAMILEADGLGAANEVLRKALTATYEEGKIATAVDPHNTELVTRVAEALYASNPLCVGADGQNLLEFTEVAKLKPHLHALLMADARAAIQAMAEALR
jgi:hypothetical protein